MVARDTTCDECARVEEPAWARARFVAVEDTAREAKAIALTAKSRGCQQIERLKQMEDSIRSWNKWFRGAVVAIVLGIIGVVGFVWQLSERANDIQNKVADVAAKQDSLQSATGDTAPADAGEQRQMIKMAVIEALEEARDLTTRQPEKKKKTTRLTGSRIERKVR